MNLRTGTAPRTALPGGPPRRSGSTLVAAGFFALAVVLAVVAVLVTRDKGGPVATRTTGDKPPASVATSPTLPPDPQAATKAAVIAAYTKSYQALIAVGKEASSNPNDPRLTENTTGAALLEVQRALADNKSKGLVYTGDAVLHPSVIALGPDTATVVDCAFDQTALIETRTGRTIIDAGPPGGSAATAKLRLEGGVWKVSDFTNEKRPCVPPAA